MTKKEEQILRHALGAEKRYPKKMWGFRNIYVSHPLISKEIIDLVRKGLMKDHGPFMLLGSDEHLFSVTVKGREAIGLSEAQYIKRINR